MLALYDGRKYSMNEHPDVIARCRRLATDHYALP